MSQKKEELFETDIDFCPRCGSILPLPGYEPLVTCRLCQFSRDVREYDGIVVHTKFVFNRVEPYKKKQKGAKTESQGPKISKK